MNQASTATKSKFEVHRYPFSTTERDYSQGRAQLKHRKFRVDVAINIFP
jgi:hypothetical protein